MNLDKFFIQNKFDKEPYHGMLSLDFYYHALQENLPSEVRKLIEFMYEAEFNRLGMTSNFNKYYKYIIEAFNKEEPIFGNSIDEVFFNGVRVSIRKIYIPYFDKVNKHTGSKVFQPEFIVLDVNKDGKSLLEETYKLLKESTQLYVGTNQYYVTDFLYKLKSFASPYNGVSASKVMDVIKEKIEKDEYMQSYYKKSILDSICPWQLEDLFRLQEK